LSVIEAGSSYFDVAADGRVDAPLAGIDRHREGLGALEAL